MGGVPIGEIGRGAEVGADEIDQFRIAFKSVKKAGVEDPRHAITADVEEPRADQVVLDRREREKFFGLLLNIREVLERDGVFFLKEPCDPIEIVSRDKDSGAGPVEKRKQFLRRLRDRLLFAESGPAESGEDW